MTGSKKIRRALKDIGLWIGLSCLVICGVLLFLFLGKEFWEGIMMMLFLFFKRYLQ